ncbi:unnamed protein product [Cylicocyclus nassatus]|uniref:J domain-containing protein n=1 Tax=Cylicocyclus nassatus TaxID=53992 RepID=A0AA36GWD8_CYLNA|nr:unnamed protein product [Cylicocyclus nassatus]
MSRRLLGSTSNACRLFSSKSNVDHYAVLGVKPSASLKEIKAAFYKLSKEYHPDRNRDNQEEAAAKFHQVSEAYEVLGSDERRRAYDLTRIRTAPDLGSLYARRPFTPEPTKQYEDIDIDYKSFEHFQRKTRQRKQFHSHFDMPEEFYAEFGANKREFKSEYEPKGSIHRDSRTIRREEEERLREIQREQERLQKKYPIPTFEEMMQKKREKERLQTRKQIAGLVSFATLASIAIIIAKKFFH